MIKLKLNRDQLQTLCLFTNPAIYEAKISTRIEWQDLSDLDMLFNIIQIGETCSKKYLYTFKDTYKINLKYTEGASLLKHTYKLAIHFDTVSYEYNFIQILRQELHQQLTNFQRRFYGQTNRQHLIAGADNGAGGTPRITAG